MKKTKKKIFTKSIANFIAVVMVLVSSPMSVFADEIDKITSVNQEIYKEEVINEDNVIEKTENKTVYELDDGLKREVIYDADVRFYDENNKLTDYDPSLMKIDSSKSDNNEDLSKYKYENKAGDKKVYLPEKISTETPILLENEKNQIKVTPIIENETSKVNVENEKTINIYDDEVTLPIKANYEDINSNMVYEYISQDNGIKENLVLNEKPESNVFEYEITVDDNLVPKKCEVEESIVFNDKKTDETKASIDVPFMNDKTGKAYSEDITYDIEQSKEDKNKYILTMTLSEDYLNDEDRVYPVEVDPTITWTGASNLIDVYILSNSKYADINFYDSGTTAFPIGYTSSMGTCRSLIRSLDLLDTVKDKYVESATLTMYETSSCDANMTVNAYRIIEGWSKATVTWNNKPRYNTSGGIMGTLKTTGTLYKARVMDITNYARGLANGTYSTDKGLMLKTNSDTSSSAGYCKFYGGRHSSSSLRPKFTVEYYDAPTIPSNIKLSKDYFKTGDIPTLTWSGIQSKSLDKVEYCIKTYDDSQNTEGTNNVVDYTEIGTTSSGSAEVSAISNLEEGCYKIFVRGVDTSGIKGEEQGYVFHIDDTAPTIGNVTFNSENDTPTITWSNASDPHFKEVQYSLNDGIYKSMGSDTSGSFIIPDEEFTQDGIYTVKVIAIDKSGNTSTEASFPYDRYKNIDITQYTPQNLNISSYYGKNLITWDIASTEESLAPVSFNIYKGTTENFTPSEDNLIADNIKTLYYADMEVGGASYYKVKAVKTGTNIESEVSTSVLGTNVNTSEFDKRLGSKGYLGYFTFDTPTGNGTIEKSKGNLTYSQTDTELPTEQLDFSLNRNYNSQSTFSGMFGLGFLDSFHKELYKVGNTIVFVESDGSIYKFTSNRGIYSCSETKDYEYEKCNETKDYEVKVRKSNSTEYENKSIKVKYNHEITTKDNTIYRFNEKGQLVVVTEPNNTFLIYTYDDLGRLFKINNSNGVEVNLQYKEGNDKYLLDKIVLPDETVLSYDYSNGKLTKFTHLKNDNLICFDKVNYCFEYDTNNLLSGIKDAKGNLYTINYNNYKATKVTYPNGENYNINYLNGLTEVSKINENNITIYTEKTKFDTNTGKVTEETDVDENITTYTYGNKNNPYLVTETSKKVDYQELNNNNEMIFKTKEVITTTDYNENEDVEEEVDEDGNVTEYTYNLENEINEHNPISIVTTTSSNARSSKSISNETFNYDSFGNLKEENDLINKTITKSEFNENGQVTLENITNTETNKTTSETIYNYDDLGNLKEELIVTDNIESFQTNKYDSMGRVTISTDGSTNNKTKTEYDYLGREKKVSLLNSSDTLIEEKENTYDENGTLIKEISNGVTTNYEYDNLNRLTKKTTSDSKGSVSYTTTYSYADADNLNTGTTTINATNLYCEKTYKNNLDDPIEIKYYDKNGNLVREKNNGVYKDYIYDNNQNTIITFEMDTISSSNKKITLSLYDENGQNTVNVENASILNGKFVSSSTSLVTKSEYDDLGNVVRETDARNISTGYTYDDQSRVISVISAEGTSLENQTIIDYSTDADSNTSITTITDANQHKSYEVKNAAGLTISTEDEGDKNDTSDNIKTSYTYDKNGNKTIETFSNGDYKKYYYDSNNQLMQTVYFEKGDNQSGKATLQTTYTYDLKENVTSMVDYKYDGNNAIPYHYTYYEYDLNGTMIGYAEINASSDPDEGVINNHKLVYNYDVEGNLSEIVYPIALNDGITSIKFEYNEYNWITKIKAKINSVDKELRDYSYNTDGTINNIKDYIYDTNSNVNGYILKKYTYDNFGRVSSMKYYNSDSDTVKESYTYTYDKNSNIKSEYIINNYPTNGSDKVNQSREYTYDVMNRLTNSLIEDTDKNNPYSVYYTYDNVGNRLSMRDENTKTVTSYTYNDLNQLISSTESKLSNSEDIVSNKNYSYDGNGNNIKEVDSIKNITKEMTYDVDNRLDTYTENNETTVQNNLYNGNGQRIQKQEGDNTINYYYQGSNVLYTTNGEGDKTSHNFVGLEGNTISTMRYDLTGLEYYVYNKDIKGSTTNIIDNNKNAKISYKYSDFGETEETGDNDFYNEIAYTGGIYDKNTSLYYLNARYYNPEDARFITQDTYRGKTNEPNTLHLYAYCANNPINYVDPTGHTLCVISHVITGSVIISMTATRSIVISSNGRIGVAKSASIGISIGPGLAKKVSANTGIQISLYGNSSRIGDLNGHSIDASMSASVGVYNAAVGTSISVKKKSSKGKVLPVASVGCSAVASFDISANLNLTYSRVKAFPYNIDYYKRHKKNNYTYYYFGEKQTIKRDSKFIDVKYYGLKLRLFNEKKYSIK